MRVLFWACLLLTMYAYAGYAVWMRVLAKLRPRPVVTSPMTVPVSIVIAVRNEEENLRRKLRNLSELRYPAELLEFVIVSDGSTDGTNAVLAAGDGRVRAILLPRSVGKAAALNEAVRVATGAVLVFMDVRQSVDAEAVGRLVACLGDASVGAVSGELLLESAGAEDGGEGLGIYWKIEKFVREQESKSGSVVGVTGAIYAMRRELFREIPAGTILDDLYVPMCVVKMGRRVLFEPGAIARDRIFAEKGKEFGRKVRTLTGNYQLVKTLPWLLTPANPLLFRFLSHKMLRLAVPFLLVGMFVSSAVLGGAVYGAIFLLQVGLYLAALAGAMSEGLRRNRLIGIATTFVMLNVAASVAFYNFVTGRTEVWMPVSKDRDVSPEAA